MALPNSNITTTMVRNILSEDNNNVGLLCTSSKVNKWSANKPGELVVSNQYLTLEVNPPYKLGDFRGYEHSAGALRVTTNNFADLYFTPSNKNITITATIDSGQIDLTQVDALTGYGNVWIQVYEGTTLLGEDYITLQEGVYSYDFEKEISLSSYSDDVSLTIEFWIGNLTTKQYCHYLSSDYNITVEYQVPPTVSLVTDINDCRVLGSVSLFGANSTEYTIYNLGGDTNDDEQNDLSGTYYLYAKLNSGSYELQKTVSLEVGHTLTFTDDLTFTPGYGDDVTFKLSAS